MPEQFLHLSPADQLDALRVASQASQRDMALLEKDIWVVWALQTLYGSSFGPSLVFKGGTSLSKAYGVIRRFSEDVKRSSSGVSS
jgi:predicted nucleotidyltransferase component of viral defense system